MAETIATKNNLTTGAHDKRMNYSLGLPFHSKADPHRDHRPGPTANYKETEMRRRWAFSEITAIVTRYSKEGPKLLAQELGRSLKSISSQAKRYGQRAPGHRSQRLNLCVPYEDLHDRSLETSLNS